MDKPEDMWYSMDVAVCTFMSNMFDTWAKKAHSYPHEYTYEQWVAKLQHSSQVLRRYADVEYAFDEYPGVVKDVQETIYWFADNIDTMWD